MFDIQVNSILIYIHLMQKLAECGKWFRVTKKNLLERFNHSVLLVSWVKPTASTSKMSSSDFQFAKVEDYYNCSLKCWARKMCFKKKCLFVISFTLWRKKKPRDYGVNPISIEKKVDYMFFRYFPSGSVIAQYKHG